MSPITEQALSLESPVATIDEARDLNSQRASSFLVPDKPTTPLRSNVCKCGDPFHEGSLVCHRCGRIRP
jgi:hypothetical protein